MLLCDLPSDLFQAAVIDLCKTTEKFWQGDNVPAMIRTKVIEMKRKRNALQRHEDQVKQLAEAKRNAVPPPKGFLLPFDIKIPKPGGDDAA